MASKGEWCDLLRSVYLRRVFISFSSRPFHLLAMDNPVLYGARRTTPVLVPKLEEAARFLVLAVLSFRDSLLGPL